MPNAVKVKICGVASPENAQLVAQAGADAIGLNFYPPSSRYLNSLSLARDIAQAVPPFVSVVALMVNASAAEVEAVLAQVPVSLLQFHGDEDAAFCEQFDRPYIKALRMKSDMNVKQAIEAYDSASGILLDAYRPGVPGGTGECFDWDRIPSAPKKPIILAGGLTPDNVAQAVSQVHPWAVDVSGGVEASPGLKSAPLVSAFVQNAKGATQSV